MLIKVCNILKSECNWYFFITENMQWGCKLKQKKVLFQWCVSCETSSLRPGEMLKIYLRLSKLMKNYFIEWFLSTENGSSSLWLPNSWNWSLAQKDVIPTLLLYCFSFSLLSVCSFLMGVKEGWGREQKRGRICKNDTRVQVPFSVAHYVPIGIVWEKVWKDQCVCSICQLSPENCILILCLIKRHIKKIFFKT